VISIQLVRLDDELDLAGAVMRELILNRVLVQHVPTLLDRDCWAQPLDRIHIRLLQLIEKLPRIHR